MKRKWIEVLPLWVLVITFLLVAFLPTQLGVWTEFKMYESDRNELIHGVRNGQIVLEQKSFNSDLLLLPPKYSHLSDGGEIFMNQAKTSFFFYSYRGILSDFNGFIYVNDSHVNDIFEIFDSYHTIKKLNEHWYWVIS
ncbi:hypothetical protein J2Z69_001811 [Paenibacillus shirakamiensis]|uniref:Uncharacterized protein n=1 Tax=Paenibacillus shirakamiensis TaxID=1265935 RepID=A0ABS4JGE0_9BACL|nr:hypothetical protein [Paenibacillus shirakamiensis]MBP2000780.1 hypothetical protein [Paenibacillus shirakamiensis]